MAEPPAKRVRGQTELTVPLVHRFVEQNLQNALFRGKDLLDSHLFPRLNANLTKTETAAARRNRSSKVTYALRQLSERKVLVKVGTRYRLPDAAPPYIRGKGARQLACDAFVMVTPCPVLCGRTPKSPVVKIFACCHRARDPAPTFLRHSHTRMIESLITCQYPFISSRRPAN